MQVLQSQFYCVCNFSALNLLASFLTFVGLRVKIAIYCPALPAWLLRKLINLEAMFILKSLFTSYVRMLYYACMRTMQLLGPAVN